MARTAERRLNPALIDPAMRSIITLAYPYEPPARARIDWPRELRGRIACYAAGPDYHDRVMQAACALADYIGEARPGTRTRVYVDTGPVLEREWAARSGLGWFGRNTNLLNVHHGSYFFLAEILTDLELDAPASAPYRNHCGRCRKCLDLCPTGALSQGCQIDSRLCISYLTIELRGAIPRGLRPLLGNWIFGCDICQEVCPWNEPSEHHNEELTPSLIELIALDDDGFRRRYRNSAVRRARRRGLLRNVAVALGNSGNSMAIRPLINALEGDPEPIVRMHAGWALGALGGAVARGALERALHREFNAAVLEEIRAALERRANVVPDATGLHGGTTNGAVG
jgi:epoxyqueuosine reductase